MFNMKVHVTRTKIYIFCFINLTAKSICYNFPCVNSLLKIEAYEEKEKMEEA